MKKLITIILLFFAITCYSQEYNCNSKIGEFGTWIAADATVNVTSTQINLKPLDGVNISVEIDKYEEGFYYFKDIVRVSIFSPQQDIYFVTVLGQTYKCKLKT